MDEVQCNKIGLADRRTLLYALAVGSSGAYCIPAQPLLPGAFCNASFLSHCTNREPASAPTYAWSCTLHALQADIDVFHSLFPLNYPLTVSAQLAKASLLMWRSNKIGRKDRGMLPYALTVGNRGVCCIPAQPLLPGALCNASFLSHCTNREPASAPTYAWSCTLHALQADIDVFHSLFPLNYPLTVPAQLAKASLLMWRSNKIGRKDRGMLPYALTVGNRGVCCIPAQPLLPGALCNASFLSHCTNREPASAPTYAWSCTLHALQADIDVFHSLFPLNYPLTVPAQLAKASLLMWRSNKIGRKDRGMLPYALTVGNRGVCCIPAQPLLPGAFCNSSSILHRTSREPKRVPTHVWSCMLHA